MEVALNKQTENLKAGPRPISRYCWEVSDYELPQHARAQAGYGVQDTSEDLMQESQNTIVQIAF